MKKEIIPFTVITLISTLLIPVIGTIFSIDIINPELHRFPVTFYRLGLWSNLIVTAMLTSLSFGIIGWLLHFKILKKIYFFSLYWFTVFLILIEGFCIAKFGLTISPPMVSIIADTNDFFEIRGFFQTYFDLASAFVIILLLFFSWTIRKYSEKFQNYIINRKKMLISLFVLAVMFSFAGIGKIGGQSASPPIIHAIYSVKYWFKVKRNIHQLSSDKANRVEITKNDSDTPFIIFIIGESESRHFMGIYNEKYDSTPLCQKLVDSGNMFVFTDTISMKSSTAQVMPPLLSFMENTTETTDLKKFDPIVDVFKKAGYQAFWISNHEKITKDLSYATYMSSRCDYSTFTSKISGNAEFTPQYSLKDEVMLPPLDAYIKEKVPQMDKNLFVMQLMGSHITYSDRYPLSFNRFKPSDIKEEGFSEHQKNILSSYLNTILYTDYILNEVIRRFKDQDAILVYVSDHGEEMWQSGFVGHGPTNVSRYMVEIPMLIWVSDSYKQSRPYKVKAIERSLHKPFMTDNLVHVLLDLADIETRQYDATKSLINPSYIIRDRIVVNGLKYEELRK